MADDVVTEIQEIEDSMADDFAAYQGDTATQERYAGLLRAQEAGGPAPPRPDAATARRTEIEKLMADPHSKYWRGSRSEAIQAEYRDLLDGERPPAQADAGGADQQAVQVSDADVDNAIGNLAAMGTVGQDFAGELSRGGAKGKLGVMEDARKAILAGMGDAAADVVQAFEANLSADAKAAVYKEMATPYAERQPDASADELARFRETGAGKILSAEWKGATAQNLSRALYRWDRMAMDLDDADADQLDDEYQRLTTAEKVAVTRHLAQ